MTPMPPSAAKLLVPGCLASRPKRTCYNPCSGAVCGGCRQLLLAEGLQQVLVGCSLRYCRTGSCTLRSACCSCC